MVVEIGRGAVPPAAARSSRKIGERSLIEVAAAFLRQAVEQIGRVFLVQLLAPGWMKMRPAE
jgi:hypothetical protein